MLGSAFHKFQQVNYVTLSCNCMIALWARSAGVLPESPVQPGEAHTMLFVKRVLLILSQATDLV